MKLIKEWGALVLLLAVCASAFIFEEELKQIPRWVGPIVGVFYGLYLTSKHVDRLEKRIQWLEENTVMRRDM